MFLLKPIVMAFILNVVGLFLFNHYLKRNNEKHLYIGISFVCVGFIIFITQYTDLLTDALVVCMLIASSILLMTIPCRMIKKDLKHARIVYIITHLIALILLSGTRSVMLIPNPFYYIIIFPMYTSLYVFRHTADKIKAFLVLGILLLLRAGFTVDYQVPSHFEVRTAFRSFYNQTDTLELTQSKPVILGVDYYNRNYSNRISSVRSIQRKDDIVILIMYDGGKNNHRLIYKDNKITDD